MVINRVIFSTLKRLMRIEGIDEDIRARLLKTLARFPHIEEIRVTEGLLGRLLGNHFGSHLGHLPGHRIYVRTVNLGQPWRKIEERVKEIVKEGRKKMRGLAKMGDQAMESLGTEARGGQDSDSKRRRELLLLRREEGVASAMREDEEGTLLLTILLGLLWKEMKL